MVFLMLAGLIAAFLAARFLARRPGRTGMAVLAVLAGMVAGEVAMFVAAIAINAADPETFPRGELLLRAIGNIWYALLGALAGLWYGRRMRRDGAADARAAG